MTGTADAILTALQREIAVRRQHLDRADDLGEITVTVKLQAGTTWVRGVKWTEERQCRSRATADERSRT